MTILLHFLLRLTFGLAIGMALTSSRRVSSGFFRNHLYVTLGLTTLAALLSWSAAPDAFWWAVMAAVVSYAGSVCWLYEKADIGRVLLSIVATAAFTGMINLLVPDDENSDPGLLDKNLSPPAMAVEADTERTNRLGMISAVMTLISYATSGLVLGVTTAAMLLGHWYLNAPGMQLAPLRRLIWVAAGAVVVHAAVIGYGLWYELAETVRIDAATGWLMLLRWAFGIFGTLGLLWMTWQTLKIPNTQSATGILYVAVIAVFAGELAGLLLSASSMFPL